MRGTIRQRFVTAAQGDPDAAKENLKAALRASAVPLVEPAYTVPAMAEGCVPASV